MISALPPSEPNQEPVSSSMLTGLIAGLTATAPMTVAMEAMHRRLPDRERWPLPPRQITARVADSAGVLEKLDEHARRDLTMMAHFGYGAAMGSIYASTLHRAPGSSAIKGAAFGLGVWAGSYLGLLPAAGILSPATRHPARRNALMVAAHLVWGITTGLITQELQRAKHDDAFARGQPQGRRQGQGQTQT